MKMSPEAGSTVMPEAVKKKAASVVRAPVGSRRETRKGSAMSRRPAASSARAGGARTPACVAASPPPLPLQQLLQRGP